MSSFAQLLIALRNVFLHIGPSRTQIDPFHNVQGTRESLTTKRYYWSKTQ